jgi:hypothetical protein
MPICGGCWCSLSSWGRRLDTGTGRRRARWRAAVMVFMSLTPMADLPAAAPRSEHGDGDPRNSTVLAIFRRRHRIRPNSYAGGVSRLFTVVRCQSLPGGASHAVRGGKHLGAARCGVDQQPAAWIGAISGYEVGPAFSFANASPGSRRVAREPGPVGSSARSRCGVAVRSCGVPVTIAFAVSAILSTSSTCVRARCTALHLPAIPVLLRVPTPSPGPRATHDVDRHGGVRVVRRPHPASLHSAHGHSAWAMARALPRNRPTSNGAA